MRIAEAIRTLVDWDRRGRAVFTVPDMRMMFPDESAKALPESLARLTRAGKGLCFYPLSRRSHGRLFEEIALRCAPANTTTPAWNAPSRSGASFPGSPCST